MSLFSEYYLERLNCRTIENEQGFMVYHILDKEFFIREYFIKTDLFMESTSFNYKHLLVIIFHCI